MFFIVLCLCGHKIKDSTDIFEARIILCYKTFQKVLRLYANLEAFCQNLSQKHENASVTQLLIPLKLHPDTHNLSSTALGILMNCAVINCICQLF